MACNEYVGKGVVSYPCTLPERHDGPHLAADSPASVGERRRWEAAQGKQQAAPALAEFQGPAQTTAQRYTENPTPVPITPGRARLHADCKPWECLVFDGGHGQRQSARDECPVYDEKVAPPAEEMPEATQSWDLPTGDGRITRLPGGVFMLHAEGRNEPVEVTQAEAIKMLAPVKHMPQDTFEVDGTTYVGEPTRTPGSVKAQVREGMEAPPHAPTKTRVGDQVLPTVNDHPDIQSQVIADIEVRRQVGIGRYGTALQPFNGRDTLVDAYEEAMDLTVYLKSLVVMKEALRPQLVDAVSVKFEQMVGGLFQGMTGSNVAREMAEAAVDAILDAALLFEPGPA